jgi:hypothetical protein
MKLYKLYNPTSKLYVADAYRTDNRLKLGFSLRNEKNSLRYADKGKIYKSTQGIRLFLGSLAIKIRYTDDVIVDMLIPPELVVIECDFNNRTFTETNAKEFYLKKKKVVTDPKIKEMLYSADEEIVKLGIELAKSNIK